MSHTSFRVQIYIKKTKYTSLWSTNLWSTATIFRFILLGDQWNLPMIYLKKKPHRPFQGSEADRLFCCFAGRGANIRPCGARFIYRELGLFKDFQLAELHDIFSPVVVHLKAEELVLAVDAAKLFTPSSIILMG